MLYILLNWLVIYVTSLVLGKLLVLFLNKLFFPKFQEKVDFIYLTLAGFAFLSFLATLYHFFLPITPYFIHSILVICLLLLPLLFKPSIQAFKTKISLYKLIIGVALGIVALSKLFDTASLSFVASHHYDDGLYYRTFVNWLTHYPVVPGLGNLHFRLANNSTWHLLTAIYEKTIFTDLRFNDLNGFLMAVSIIHASSALYSLIIHKVNTLSNYASILILPFLIYPEGMTFFTIYNYGIVTSPTPDLPAAILTWYIFILALQKIEQGAWHLFDLNTLLIIILICFAITVKLSAAPLALLVVILFFSQALRKEWLVLIWISSLTLLFVSPWIISNVILSGYLVFPIYQIDLFSFEWKVADALVQYAAIHVGNWAKMPGIDQHNAQLSEWLPGWYERMPELVEQYLWLVIYAHIVFWGLLLFTFAKKKKLLYTSYPFLIFYLVMLVGTLVWFFNIPDFRFGFGFTLITVVLFGAILIKEFLFEFRVLLALGYIVYLLSNLHDSYYAIVTDKKGIFYQVPIDNYPVQVKTVTTNTGKIYLPVESDQCWDAKLPCTPHYYEVDGKKVKFRSNEVAAGFYMPSSKAGIK